MTSSVTRVSTLIVISAAMAAATGPACAGTVSMPVPEPGLTGLFAGTVVLALGLVYHKRKK